MRLNTELLRQMIKDKGLTIEETANRAGITRQNLHMIFLNKSTKIETVGKIGEALNMDPKDLLIS